MTNLTPDVHITPDRIIEVVFRHKWLILSLFAVFLTIGFIKTLTAERVYQASTMILVQPQQVPTSYVRSVMSSGIEERISSISQQIMSRTNLEKIINKFDLYKNKKDMYLEDKIKNLSKRIEVSIKRSRQRRSSAVFTIQFKGNQPDRVMNVTNSLATFFMDDNLKQREDQVVGTSTLLDEELEKIKERLELKEKEIAKYRSDHVGELPSELESNLRTLDRLQSQLTNSQIALRDAQNSEISLRHQIIIQKEFTARPPSPSQTDIENENRGARRTTDRNELKRLKEELSDLLIKYTDKHPDVVKLKKSILRLEAKIEKSGEVRVSDSSGDLVLNADPEVMELELRHKQVQRNIRAIMDDIQATKEKMRYHERIVEQIPRREQELQKLTRDYAGIQNVYTSFLNRRLEADLSVNMEQKQKAELFRVLDYAIRPEKPISPNVMFAFIVSVGVAGVFSCGIIYLSFLFDNAVRRKEDIEEIFKLPVLVEIGAINQQGDKLKNFIKAGYFTVLFCYIAAMSGAFLMLELYGLERSINLFNSFITLN